MDQDGHNSSSSASSSDDEDHTEDGSLRGDGSMPSDAMLSRPRCVCVWGGEGRGVRVCRFEGNLLDVGVDWDGGVTMGMLMCLLSWQLGVCRNQPVWNDRRLIPTKLAATHSNPYHMPSALQCAYT